MTCRDEFPCAHGSTCLSITCVSLWLQHWEHTGIIDMVCLLISCLFYAFCIRMSSTHMATLLPYNRKRKQLLKMTFLVNEQNVSVMYIDINASRDVLTRIYFSRMPCFCSKLGIQVEYAKSNLKTSLSQIWVICQLLPFVSVGQTITVVLWHFTCWLAIVVHNFHSFGSGSV